MKKSTSRRRTSSSNEDDIFSARKKYFRVNDSIFALDKKALKLIHSISSKLRKSVGSKKNGINRNTEMRKYFEDRLNFIS